MTTTLTDVVKAYDVRGLVPDQLDVHVAAALGAAFAEVVAIPDAARAVTIGHDMRSSSPELAAAFTDGITAQGVDAVVIGLTSTDGLYYASGALGMPGAMFTASHNPARYNGIKFCRSGARPVSRDSGLARIRDLARQHLEAGTTSARDVTPGRVDRRDMTVGYAAFLRGLVDLTGSRPLRVTVDAGNGMGGLTVPAVLGTEAGLPELPLAIDAMYFELDGAFPNHEANPLEPANLTDLQERVRTHGADIGIAFDGDADRCFVVDERGEAVSPSAITAMIARREIGREVLAGRHPGEVAVVHNAITSAAVPEIIAECGARSVRTRVGHSFVKGLMAEHDAVFGGEHSAHYYFRDFWFADTGMLAAMHVLAALGESNAPLSEVMAPFERYVASGEINSTVADADAVTERVQASYADRDDTTLDHLDGLTVTRAQEPMWWFNLRTSNTEPLLRLNVEAADAPTMTRVRDDVLMMIREGR